MIVRITGGLGNQMFQYAIKLKLEELLTETQPCLIDISYYKDKKIHNGYELNRIFGIDNSEIVVSSINYNKYKIISKICNKMGIHFVSSNHFLIETLLGYYSKIDLLKHKKANFFLDGCWQSEDYFFDIAQKVRNTFSFPQLDEQNKAMLLNAKQKGNLVSIHVRRGDFTKCSFFVDLSNTNYYENAINYIKKHIKNPIFLIFSDEPKWADKMLSNFIQDDLIMVNWNIGNNSYKDMQLMSLCDSNILANSSFSWWAGWLNDNKNKIVIVPKKFYTDGKRDESHLIPKTWVAL